MPRQKLGYILYFIKKKRQNQALFLKFQRTKLPFIQL